MEFWTEPQMASIHKMLNPRSIAIVGATPRMQYGGRFLAADAQGPRTGHGFMHREPARYDEIMGVKSYPSVTDLPEVSRRGGHRGALRPGARCPPGESPQGGRDAAIVISAGFAERGRGRSA